MRTQRHIHTSQAWLCSPVIPELKRQSQEDHHQFKVSLSYIKILKLARALSLKKKKSPLSISHHHYPREWGVLSSTMPKLPIFHTQKRGWGGTGCSSGPALVLRAVSTKLHPSTAETANYKRMDGQTTVHPPYGGVSDNGALDAEICIIKSSWSVDSGDRRQIQVGHRLRRLQKPRLRADLHFVHLEGLEGPQWKTCTARLATCFVPWEAT